MIANNCGIVVLAGGESSRMGRPKQLLPYKGKSLLEHTVDIANDANADPVIVVLGANAESLEKIVDEKKVHIVENKEWKEGMASSIRCGLNTLMQVAPLSDSVILMVCDQPYISASLLNELIATQKNGQADRYQSISGRHWASGTFLPHCFSRIIGIKR